MSRALHKHALSPLDDDDEHEHEHNVKHDSAVRICVDVARDDELTRRPGIPSPTSHSGWSSSLFDVAWLTLL